MEKVTFNLYSFLWFLICIQVFLKSVIFLLRVTVMNRFPNRLTTEEVCRKLKMFSQPNTSLNIPDEYRYILILMISVVRCQYLQMLFYVLWGIHRIFWYQWTWIEFSNMSFFFFSLTLPSLFTSVSRHYMDLLFK